MKIALLLLTAILAHANDGGGSGTHGGDTCQKRILAIAADIDEWIGAGGADELTLPNGIALDAYKSRMLEKLPVAKVECTSELVKVDGKEKTCMNFLDAKKVPQIKCNTERFNSTTEDDQYVLVHHEYAGLAGLESGNDQETSYAISDQISGFLETQLTKKLAVRRPEVRIPPGGFWRKTDIISGIDSYIIVNGKALSLRPLLRGYLNWLSLQERRSYSDVLFGGGNRKSVFDILPILKIVYANDRNCRGADGRQQEAVANLSNETICLSLNMLQARLEQTMYKREVISLLAREVARLVGASSEQAEALYRDTLLVAGEIVADLPHEIRDPDWKQKQAYNSTEMELVISPVAEYETGAGWNKKLRFYEVPRDLLAQLILAANDDPKYTVARFQKNIRALAKWYGRAEEASRRGTFHSGINKMELEYLKAELPKFRALMNLSNRQQILEVLKNPAETDTLTLPQKVRGFGSKDIQNAIPGGFYYDQLSKISPRMLGIYKRASNNCEWRDQDEVTIDRAVYGKFGPVYDSGPYNLYDETVGYTEYIKDGPMGYGDYGIMFQRNHIAHSPTKFSRFRYTFGNVQYLSPFEPVTDFELLADGRLSVTVRIFRQKYGYIEDLKQTYVIQKEESCREIYVRK